MGSRHGLIPPERWFHLFSTVAISSQGGSRSVYQSQFRTFEKINPKVFSTLQSYGGVYLIHATDSWDSISSSGYIMPETALDDKDGSRAMAHYIALMPDQIKNYNKISGAGFPKTQAFRHLHLLKGRCKCKYILFIDCGLIRDKYPNAIALRLAAQDGKITTENSIPRECIVQAWPSVCVNVVKHRSPCGVILGDLRNRLSDPKRREKSNYDNLFAHIAETFHPDQPSDHQTRFQELWIRHPVKEHLGKRGLPLLWILQSQSHKRSLYLRTTSFERSFRRFLGWSLIFILIKKQQPVLAGKHNDGIHRPPVVHADLNSKIVRRKWSEITNKELAAWIYWKLLSRNGLRYVSLCRSGILSRDLVCCAVWAQADMCACHSRGRLAHMTSFFLPHLALSLSQTPLILWAPRCMTCLLDDDIHVGLQKNI